MNHDTPASTQLPTDRRVRVWLGEHVIAEYTGEPATAIRFQAAMTQRLAGLRITIRPMTGAADSDDADS